MAIEILESRLKYNEIKIIDFSDHQCWEDFCQVLTPTGYSVYFDWDHYTILYSKYWASTVDFMTEF